MAQIDSLEIKITSSSEAAIASLQKLESAVKSLSSTISSQAKPIRSLALAVKAISNAEVKEGTIQSLRSLSEALKTFSGTENIKINGAFVRRIQELNAAVHSSKANDLRSIAGALKTFQGVDPKLSKSFVNTLTALNSTTESMTAQNSTAVGNMATALSKFQNFKAPSLSQGFINGLKEIANVSNTVNTTSGSNLGNLATSLKEFGGISIKGIPSTLGQNIKTLVEQADKLKTVDLEPLRNVLDIFSNFQGAKSIPKDFATRLIEVGEAAEKLSDEAIDRFERFAEACKNISGVDFRRLKEAMNRGVADNGKANDPIAQLVGDAAEGKGFDLGKAIGQNMGSAINSAGELDLRIVAIKVATIAAQYAVTEFVQSVKEVAGFLKNVAIVGVEAFKKVGSAIANAAKETAKFTMSKIVESTPVFKFADSIKSAVSQVKNLSSGLARIGMYRILRTVFKDITSSLDESIQALYKFDAGIGGSFAKTMDNITAGTQELKASLGTLAGNIINILSPAINAAINIVTALMDALSALFAVLGGNIFYKAADSSSKFGDTMTAGGKAAKEWKNQLLGFDEINKLTDSDGGGGGGGASKLPITFEEMKELPDWLKRIQELLAADKWREAGYALADHLNDVISSWDAKAWGERLGQKIQHGISFAVGFFSNTQMFETAGTKLAQAVNGIISKINGKEVGELFAKKTNAIFTAIDAFVLEFNENDFGEQIGNTMQSWFDTIDSDKITATLSHTLGAVLDFMREFIKSFSLRSAVKKLSETIEQGLTDVGTQLENSTAIKELSDWVNKVDWETAAGNVARGVGKLGNAIIKKLAELQIGTTLSRAFRSALTSLQVFIDTFDFDNALRTMATEINKFLAGCANGIEQFDLSSAITKLTTDIDYADAISTLANGAIKLINALTGKLKEFNSSENIGSVQESIRQMFASVDWAGLFGAIADLAVQWFIFKLKIKFAAGWGAIQGVFSSLFNSVFGDEAQREAEQSAITVLNTLDMLESHLRQSADAQSQAMADAIEDYAFEMRNMTLEEISDFQAENEALTTAIEQLATEYGLASIKATQAEESINGTIEAAEAAKETFNGIQDVTEGIKTATEEVAVERIDEAAAKSAELQEVLPETAQLIQDTIVKSVQEAEQNFKDTFTTMTTDVTDFKDAAMAAFDELKLSATDLRTSLETDFESLKGSIQSLKDAWTSNWGSPYIPLPHFNISGMFSLWPPQVPSISVDWFAKGGVVDGATLIGAGEAGKEAIVPLEHNMGWVSAVADQMSDEADGSDDVVNAVYTMAEMIVSAINNKDMNTYLDGKQVTNMVTKQQRMSARAMGV